MNVFPVYMPPLRERRTDILLIAEFFLEKYSKENNKNIRRISTSAIDMLIQYHWPGNVRELQNCIERAVLICDDDSIKGIHLPPTLQLSETKSQNHPLSLTAAVENFEKELIIEGLKKLTATRPRPQPIWTPACALSTTRSTSTRLTPASIKSSNETSASCLLRALYGFPFIGYPREGLMSPAIFSTPIFIRLGNSRSERKPSGMWPGILSSL